MSIDINKWMNGYKGWLDRMNYTEVKKVNCEPTRCIVSLQNEVHREVKKVNCEPTRCIVSLQNEVHREIKKVKCEPTRCIVSLQNEVYASYKDLNLWLVVEELHVVEEGLGLGFLGALRLVFGLDVSTADQLDVRFPRSKNAKRLNKHTDVQYSNNPFHYH